MRRNLVRLLGLSLAAVAVILYINSIGDSDETASDPARRLQCAENSEIAAAYATASPTSRETRSPAQLATAWAQVRPSTLIKGMHQVYSEPARVDIAFDAKAHTVAVLTFRSHDPLGWHLEAVVACQESGLERPTAPTSGP
ncbi:hypothetical protein ACFPIJ_34855 [Dactylosporangium cerinum]|uniref:Secreted protein n=1 Tax=Dactylosporangium cerinum TaxID=1434730 RepID=A0ABV9W2V8_9ACTN